MIEDRKAPVKPTPSTLRAAAVLLGDADRATCLHCNDIPGPCTCGRPCGGAGCAGRPWPDCRVCGCPELRHRHHHTRDYCGTCEGCDSYRPRLVRRWRWQIWRQP